MGTRESLPPPKEKWDVVIHRMKPSFSESVYPLWKAVRIMSTHFGIGVESIKSEMTRWVKAVLVSP